uniref:Uncharacterized protein n=1 Tax=Arundo donax TaxID=35708 RepID=A0A0A9AAL3_ARUDO
MLSATVILTTRASYGSFSSSLAWVRTREHDRKQTLRGQQLLIVSFQPVATWEQQEWRSDRCALSLACNGNLP